LTHSGEEAIEVTRTFGPELVILDLNMSPGMDGYEAAVQLRRQTWSTIATFVAHTASSDPSVAEEVKRAGFGFFVPKPASPSEFEEIVKALREKSRLG